jgi:hypothetical protein
VIYVAIYMEEYGKSTTKFIIILVSFEWAEGFLWLFRKKRKGDE